MYKAAFFKGLNVVDLSSVLAGPRTAQFFAEHGAEVVKIENTKSGGDVTRRWKTPFENQNSEFSAYYACCNLFKKVVQLDLTNESDYKRLLNHVKKADIVITNFQPSVGKKLNVNPEALLKIKPNLIVGLIKGYRQNDNAAYDAAVQAESGLMSINGTAESGPLKFPIAIVDVLASHQMIEGLLMALLKRSQSKKGSVVEVSLMDSALSSLVNQASGFLMTGKVPGTMGSLHPHIAPYGESYQTKDGQVVILAVGTDKQFKNLCEILGLSELADLVKFSSNVSRISNRIELNDLLKQSFLQKEWSILEHRFKELKVPVSKISNIEEAVLKYGKDLIMTDIKGDNELKSLKSSIFSLS